MPAAFPLSRRRWLAGMAATATVMAWSRYGWAEAALDPRVASLVSRTIGIDTHNHIDLSQQPDVLPQPDIDLAGAMRRSGLSAICMAFATDYQKFADPEDGYRRFLNALGAADRQLARNHMQRSLTAEQVRAAHAHHRPTVIQAVEGAHWLDGKIERIDEAHARGLRHFGLLHDHDAAPPLGDNNTLPEAFHGLTPLGADVIRACNRAGILIDLAHASAETTAAALKLSKTPVIFSHTGLNTRLDNDPEVAKAVYGKLVSPDQARAIAASGGVVGVWTHLAATPDEYGENVRAMVDVCGIDHVCIGTDAKLTPPLGNFGGPGTVPPRRSIGGPMERIWPDMAFGFYAAVVGGLLKAGFHDDEIAKIGGANYLRVFGMACG